jgi:proline iminopeptidase
MDEFPAEFLIRSAIGVFRMVRNSGVVCGHSTYGGSANGFVCRMLLNSRTGEYSISLTYEGTEWANSEVNHEGRTFSVEGLAAETGLWMDSVCPDTLLTDNSHDVRYLESSNGKIAYYVYNEKLSKIPALFIHGGPGGESNTERVRRLALDRPVYLYDQLGCGRSDPIPDLTKWCLNDYVEELRQVILTLKLKKVILVGASWGAGLAVSYAERYGCNGIAAMILPSPFLSSEKWTEDQRRNIESMPDEFVEAMDECIARKDYGDAYHKLMGDYNARFLFARPENAEIARQAAAEPYSDVALALWGPDENVCSGTLRDFDAEKDLWKVKTKVLLMCGDSDEVSLETMAIYRTRFIGSKLMVVPNAGHALAFEQPELYCAGIEAFLSQNGL